MISFSNIDKQSGKRLLFVDASFQLNPGEKVGLVGPNGAGKTTLFRMVVGEETPDEGAVSVPKKLTIGYFRQDVEEMQGRPVRPRTVRNQYASSAMRPGYNCAHRWRLPRAPNSGHTRSYRR
jgi:ATPase subunit of ABC transporter with duplicated ATPase domains